MYRGLQLQIPLNSSLWHVYEPTNEVVMDKWRLIRQVQWFQSESSCKLHTGDSMLHPSDSILHPSDSILHPSDSMLHPSDSILHRGNSMMHPSDSMLHRGNSMMHPSDSMLPPSDSMLHPNDSMLYPGDSMLHPGDSMLHLGNPSDSSCNHMSLYSDTQTEFSTPEGCEKIQQMWHTWFTKTWHMNHEPWTFHHGTSTP